MNIDLIVPRRLEERKERYKRIIYKKIQDYIKNGSKGDLDLIGSPKIELPSTLITIGGGLNIGDSSITEINNIIYIQKIAFFDRSSLCKLPENLYVGEYLSVEGCHLLSELPNGLKCDGALWINNTPITEIPLKLRIGGTFYIGNSLLSEKYTDYEIIKLIKQKGGHLYGTISRKVT